jgi:signal transduction histidine kinase/CheY-like chemotaxis protein
MHVRDMRFLLERASSDSRHACLRESIDAMPVGMGIAVAGQCRFANPALRAMTGMQAGEVVPGLLMNALDAPRAGNQAARASGGYMRLPDKNGGTGDFLFNSAAVECDGESGVVLCLADISGQKRLEQALIAARETAESAASARGQFLAMVSHEVRTPLNGVMGILQLASLQVTDSDLKEHLDTAFSLCGNLLQILSDILDISKIESGSLSIVAEEFALDNTVRNTLAPFQAAARNKNISLHCSVDPALPETLFGDAGRVHQLLLNLVGNAVKYTQTGQIELEILRVPARDAGTLWVLFAVSDTGVGIPAEKMVDIFEPFHRVDDGYVLRQAGVGLGLAIVRRLVRLMGGDICLFSQEGLGTENHLVLPFELPAEPETPPESVSEAASGNDQGEDRGNADSRSWSAPRILVVDDDATNLMTMRLLLDALGYPADTAESGPQALQMLKERSYALVFMDIPRPGMAAYEATARKRAAPGPDAPAIVALTAHTMRGDREKMLSQGFDEYMAKPVIVEDLKALLRRLIG